MILIVYREKQLKNIIKGLKTLFYIAARIIAAENFKLRRNNKMGYYIIKKLVFLTTLFFEFKFNRNRIKNFLFTL